MVKGYDDKNRKRSFGTADKHNDLRPEKRTKVNRWKMRSDDIGPKKEDNTTRTKDKVEYQDHSWKKQPSPL